MLGLITDGDVIATASLGRTGHKQQAKHQDQARGTSRCEPLDQCFQAAVQGNPDAAETKPRGMARNWRTGKKIHEPVLDSN